MERMTEKYRALFSRYFANGHVRFDTEGVIGAASARKTKEYISWISTPEEAMRQAEEIILNPRNRFGGRIEDHDYLPNKKVAIFDRGLLYVKVMTSGGYLWIDIHLDGQVE